MRLLLPWVVLMGAAGCTGDDNFTYKGYVMEDFFPFDGNRSWEFINSDLTIPYKIFAELRPGSEPALDDRVDVFTIDYDTVCLGGAECDESMEGWLRSVGWSSDQDFGTLMHGWDSPGTGPIAFENPIGITDDTMEVNDVVDTTTDGVHLEREVRGGRALRDPLDGPLGRVHRAARVRRRDRRS